MTPNQKLALDAFKNYITVTNEARKQLALSCQRAGLIQLNVLVVLTEDIIKWVYTNQLNFSFQDYLLYINTYSDNLLPELKPGMGGTVSGYAIVCGELCYTLEMQTVVPVPVNLVTSAGNRDLF